MTAESIKLETPRQPPNWRLLPEELVRHEIIPFLGRKRLYIEHSMFVWDSSHTSYTIHIYDNNDIWYLYASVQMWYDKENDSSWRTDDMKLYEGDTLISEIYHGRRRKLIKGKYGKTLLKICKYMRKIELIYLEEEHVRLLFAQLFLLKK